MTTLLAEPAAVRAEPAPRWRSPGTAAAALIAGYLAVGVALLPGYRYQLNPDGVSYLAIAHHYADGYWREAVNGYWGPLYSWLLAPLLAAGADGLLAARCLNLAVGTLTLAGGWALAGRYTERPWLRVAAVGALVPVLLGWAYTLVTPDLLLVTALLGYLYAVTAPGFRTTSRYAVLAGLAAGIAFLAKAYAFPFFLAHFCVLGAWRWYRGGSGRVLATGLATFAAIAGPWIAVISAKYSRLTYGTSSGYNWNLIGPGHLDHPTHRPGLIEPTGPHATSGWEDPGRFDLPGWSALDQPAHLARVVAGNAADLALIVVHFTPLALVLVPLVLLGLVGLVGPRSGRLEPLLSRRLEPARRGLLGLTAFTVGVFSLGYLIVVVEPRYLWLVLVLLLLAGLLLVGTIRRRTARVVATAVLVASFWVPAAGVLRDGHGAGAADATTATLIRRQAPEVVGRRIASNGSYRSSLFISYHLAGRYYGLVPAATGDAAGQLIASHVEYLLFWGDPATAPSYLRTAPVVFERGTLHVYDLR